MAQTYAQHKTAVDAAMPTPAIAWQLLDHNPDEHRSTETARFMSMFDGMHYHYVASTYFADDVATFGINRVEARTRGRSLVVAAQASWGAATAAFETYWSAACDAVRSEIATRNYGMDVLSDAGAVSEISHNSRLSSLASPTVGQDEFTLVTLAPEFDADTLVYTATAYNNQLQFNALPQDSGAAFRWVHGERVILGNSPSPTFTLEVGENLIVLHVTAQDGYTTRAYRMTVTR